VSDRICFHFDEHIDPDVAAALRRHGADVTTTVESGLRSADDHAHLEYAMEHNRVIVTDDPDFLHIAGSHSDHPGIVICHRRLRSTREIIRGLILVYEVLTPEEMRGRVEFL
jgi:predicted nuclease of predicted toxin-antitoxin system